MKNKYAVIGVVSSLVIGGLGFVFLSGGGNTSNQHQNSESSGVQPSIIDTQPSADDEELLRFVDKDSIEYKNAVSFQGEEYDQYFIANMIHYSEGIAQLEENAVTSTDMALVEGAANRAKEALVAVQSFKKLQKDLGQPASYGRQMQYHGAMGADTEVYFATSTLDGLSGADFEAKLREKLDYFRRLETQISGAGINNASDSRVKELVVKTLKNNATILERL